MSDGFFDHFFYWTFVVASLLTVTDWWIGPEGRGRMREQIGLWWLHVSEASFTGLAAEDARRVERWLRRVFGQRWLGLRALLLCSTVSLGVSIALLLANWAAVTLQADLDSEVANVGFVVGKGLLGYDLTVDDIELSPAPAPGDANGEEVRQLKEALLHDLRALVAELRPTLMTGISDFLLPLALLNALFDWLSLGFTLLMLGWMARSVSSARLAGLITLDLVVAVLLAVAVALLTLAYALGPEELLAPWLTSFNDNLALTREVIHRLRAVMMQAGIWEGLAIIPALVLFTSALPSLLHLGVAAVFLASKLFRPVLQPAIGRLLYLFHVSRQGVLTQIAVGGGIVAKAVQESVKYFST